MTLQKIQTTVPATFYKLFDDAAIEEMMTSLAAKNELPLKFSYVGEGAQRWDQAIQALPAEKQSRILPPVQELFPIIDEYFKGQPVQVIDLGPGNGLQARDLLLHLQNQKTLQRYIGLDISQRMLDVASANIRQWSGGEVRMEKHVFDFVSQPPQLQILTSQTLPRLVLILGGTLDNDPSPQTALSQIRQEMGPADLLLYDVLTPLSDQPSSETQHELSARHTFLLQQLGLSTDMYEGWRVYDSSTHTRTDQVRCLKEVTIIYSLHGAEQHLTLQPGEPVTVWRYHSQTAAEAVKNLTAAGLSLMEKIEPTGRRQALLLCRPA